MEHSEFRQVRSSKRYNQGGHFTDSFHDTPSHCIYRKIFGRQTGKVSVQPISPKIHSEKIPHLSDTTLEHSPILQACICAFPLKLINSDLNNKPTRSCLRLLGHFLLENIELKRNLGLRRMPITHPKKCCTNAARKSREETELN